MYKEEINEKIFGEDEMCSYDYVYEEDKYWRVSRKCLGKGGSVCVFEIINSKGEKFALKE